MAKIDDTTKDINTQDVKNLANNIKGLQKSLQQTSRVVEKSAQLTTDVTEEVFEESPLVQGIAKWTTDKVKDSIQEGIDEEQEALDRQLNEDVTDKIDESTDEIVDAIHDSANSTEPQPVEIVSDKTKSTTLEDTDNIQQVEVVGDTTRSPMENDDMHVQKVEVVNTSPILVQISQSKLEQVEGNRKNRGLFAPFQKDNKEKKAGILGAASSLFGGMGKGLGVLTGGLGKLLKMGAGILAAGAGLALLTASLYGMTYVLREFETIDWETIGKGGAVLLGVVGSLALLGSRNSMGLILAAGSMALLAGAMWGFSKVLKEFIDIDWDTLGKAGATLGAATLALAILGTNAPMMLLGTLAVGALALAMWGLSAVLKEYESIEWETIGKAGAVLGGVGIALGLLGAAAPVIFMGALALGAASLALAVFGGAIGAVSWGIDKFNQVVPGLVNSFHEFGKIEWSSIGKAAAALGALGAALIPFGIGGAIGGIALLTVPRITKELQSLLGIDFSGADNVAKALGKLGVALGEFGKNSFSFGGLIDSIFGNGAIESLEKLAGVADGVKSLGEVNVDVISRLGNIDMEKFMDTLTDGIDDINVKKVGHLKDIKVLGELDAETITKLASINLKDFFKPITNAIDDINVKKADAMKEVFLSLQTQMKDSPLSLKPETSLIEDTVKKLQIVAQEVYIQAARLMEASVNEREEDKNNAPTLVNAPTVQQNNNSTVVVPQPITTYGKDYGLATMTRNFDYKA